MSTATSPQVVPPRRRGRGTRRSWLVPPALIFLSLIPLIAGVLRVIELSGGPEIIPTDHRFEGSPLPLIVHIAGAALYTLLGAFQFVPQFRRRHPNWHRRAGRLVAVAGLLVAGSAIWVTLLYSQKPGTGDLLYLLRLVVAPLMIAFVVLGVTAARRRDITAHRAWMIRAFALALGAGTQALLTEPLGAALLGTGDVRGDLAKGAAWVLNLAVAEWVIRRPDRTARREQRRRGRRAVAPPTATAPARTAAASAPIGRPS
jgi:uncharacterized membrane protein